MTITPTQFNRESSRVLKALRAGEDVLIKLRNEPDLIVSRVDKEPDPIEQGIREGWITPATNKTPWAEIPTIKLPPEVVRDMIAELDAEADPFAY